MREFRQAEFDEKIGQLDRILSLMIFWVAAVYEVDGKNKILDEPNRQTLKHHAEDMIGAGQKILKDLDATKDPDQSARGGLVVTSG